VTEGRDDRRPPAGADGHFETEHLRSGLKAKALKGAGFSVFAQTANYGLQTIGTIIMARILSPEDFGLVAMVAVFSILVQNFGFNGFTEAVIQQKELSADQLSKLFWVNALIMAGLTVLFAALAPAIAWFYGEPVLKGISTGLALSIIFSGLGTCHLALMGRNMKFNQAAVAQVLGALISTVLGIGAALAGTGYWSLVLRRVSLPLATTVFAWVLCRWRPGRPAKGTDIRPMLMFGYKTYGNFLLSHIRNNLDKILVGKAFGKAPLGHYDRAYNLSSVLPNQLTIALTSVGIATLSRLTGDTRKYLSYFSKALAILCFVGFPGSVLFTILGKDIIFLLLGDQWSIAGDIFAALGPGIGVFVIYNTSVWLHVSLGRADRLLKWSVVVLAASVVSYSLGLLFGPLGVAIAYSAMFYVLLIPALWYAGRPAGIKPSFYLAIIWKYWAAAFGSGLLYWAAFRYVSPAGAFYGSLGVFGRIVLGSILYAGLYMAAIAALFKGLGPVGMFVEAVRGMLARERPAPE
jgi:PST family polysaccharide transporter